MSAVPTFAPMSLIGPAPGGLFIAMMSLVPHPARRSFNTIFAAGAVGAYIGGAFGPWELVYPILATPVVYLGLRSYRAIGVAWLMHAAWDLPHQLAGHPIWPYAKTSSLGCMVDSVVAVWFLAGRRPFWANLWRYRSIQKTRLRQIGLRCRPELGLA